MAHNSIDDTDPIHTSTRVPPAGWDDAAVSASDESAARSGDEPVSPVRITPPVSR
ncbi:MAG: hypothetical protein PPP55_00375 [Halorubrum sp.]